MPGDNVGGRAPRPCLTVRIESRSFGARPVLGRLHFEAVPGQVVALLAPSGTGKSTVLRIVLGLDRGFNGRVGARPSPIGAVFQEPRLLPWATVEENLRLVAPASTAAELAGLLAAVALEGAEDLRPGQLSLGMARRVALARAWAVRPALLVLDEPFASLDARLASRLAAEMSRRAQDTGAIVLMATHDLDQALQVADRVLVLGGSPACLVADVAVGSNAELAAGLRARFAFLGALPQTPP